MSAEEDPIPHLFHLLLNEIDRQDAKHGAFTGSRLGRSRLAIACIEDEVREAREAWRKDRPRRDFKHTRPEVLQVAAVAMRALRDALADGHDPAPSNSLWPDSEQRSPASG